MKNQATNQIGRRAIALLLCDLVVIKTCRSCVRNWLLATLVAGGTFSLHAQGDAADANATAATNTATTTEVSTNTAVIHTAAAEPSPVKEPEAKPAPSSGKLDYSSFKSVAERNIFNGNRSGQRMTATRSSTQQRSVRVESFTLVGTLLSEDKDPVAFFDGTGSESRKALKQGGSLAGFTVKEILHAGVRLAEGTNTLDVFVGTGMRREDEGLWKSSTTGASYASSSSGGGSSDGGSGYAARSNNSNGGRSSSRNGSSGRGNNGDSSATTSNSSSSDSPPSAEVNEVLKRLMEKREKE